MVRVTGIILRICVCGEDVLDRVRKEERGHALRTWGGFYNLVDCPLHSVIFRKGNQEHGNLCS